MGEQRVWHEDGGPTRTPVTEAAQHPPPTPTLPAGVPLGVLQGLGRGGKRDALKDVHRVAADAQEGELLVDAFHEAPFCVHHTQLGKGQAQGASGAGQ